MPVGCARVPAACQVPDSIVAHIGATRSVELIRRFHQAAAESARYADRSMAFFVAIHDRYVRLFKFRGRLAKAGSSRDRDLTATACSISTGIRGRATRMAEVPLALRLIAVAAVGIALEAPIFVAVTLTFALVAFLGAAIDASMRHPTPHRPARPQRHDAGR